eukprot:TRINITY_DN1581_c0_g1_i2.p1 TRINITY_DN1581_c0_g1~~TRINITY_DN1581_c0_g1_i2.p1  ORF type:complete len:865 (-),score=229.26 TRINITY_DN1581_c0_g1_i2:61-2655(-)
MSEVILGDYIYTPNEDAELPGDHSQVSAGSSSITSESVAVKRVKQPSSRDGAQLFQALKAYTKAEKGRLAKEGHLNENVLHLFDVQEHAGDLFIITELAEGTLEGYLKRKSTLPETAAVALLKGIAAVLNVKCSEQKLFEKPLTPDNIMYVSSGSDIKLKVSNLPLSPYLDPNAPVFKGATGYLSPEQIKGTVTDAGLAHVYSAGLIFYRALAGKLPYASLDELEWELINPEPFALPAEVEVSDSTKDLLNRLLHKEPEQRMPFPEFMKMHGFAVQLVSGPPPSTTETRPSNGAHVDPTDELITKLDEANKEISNLKRQVIDLENSLGDDDIVAVKRQADAELRSTREELVATLHQMLALEQQYDKMETAKQQELDRVYKDLEECHKHMANAAKAFEELQAKARRLEDRRKEDIEDVKKEWQEIVSFKDSALASVKKELEDATDTCATLEKARKTDGATARDRYEDLEVRYEELQLKIKKVQRDADDELDREHEKTQESEAKYKAELDKLRRAVEDAQASPKSSSVDEKAVQALERKFKTQIDDLTDQIDEKDKKIGDLDRKHKLSIEELRDDIEDKEKRIQDLEKRHKLEVADLSSSLDERDKKISEAERKHRGELEDLRKQIMDEKNKRIDTMSAPAPAAAQTVTPPVQTTPPRVASVVSPPVKAVPTSHIDPVVGAAAALAKLEQSPVTSRPTSPLPSPSPSPGGSRSSSPTRRGVTVLSVSKPASGTSKTPAKPITIVKVASPSGASSSTPSAPKPVTVIKVASPSGSSASTAPKPTSVAGKKAAASAVPSSEGLPVHTADELRVMLKSTKTPFPNFDRNRVELYLTQEEFESLFKLTREEFYKFPKWRQDSLRVNLKLV